MAYTVYYNTPGTILTYSQMQSAMAALASANSWTYQTFGQSENGVNIDGVIIAPNGYQYTVYVQCGIHGDEKWPTRAALDLLNYFDQTPAAIDPAIRYIIIPSVNPDGYEKGTRKNDNDLSDDGLVPWPRYVDINRNLDYLWSSGGSTDPGNTAYRGPQAASESEAQAIQGIFSTYDIDLFIDGHTTLNYVSAAAGFYAFRFPDLSAALTANEFSVPTLQVSQLKGASGAYAYNVGKSPETYVVELLEDESTSIHEQVNRFICMGLSLFGQLSTKRFNRFLKDETCVAHFRFNDVSGLTVDDQGLVILNNNGPATKDTTNYYSGDCSAHIELGTSQWFFAYDSLLPSNFPLKSGTTNKKLGFFARFRMDALPASGVSKAIISKYQSVGASARSFAVTIRNNGGIYEIRLMFGYSSGASVEGIVAFAVTPSPGEWYFIAGGIKDSDKSYYVEFWDDTERLNYASGNYTNAISLTTAPFQIGASSVGTPYYSLGGNVDEVGIFTEVLTESKIADIWAGEYGWPVAAASATGALAATLADSTSSSTGTVAITGVSAKTLADSTVAATGNAPIVGSLAQTLASATLSASTSSGLSGALTSTLADATGAAAGTAAITGSLAATLATATVAGAGTVAVSGSLASTLEDASLSSGSSSSAIGALASTLESATVSASGAVSVSGSLSATLADATLSAYFGDSTPAQLSSTLASATMAATGEVAIMGALSAALQDAFAASEGEVDIDAECAAILADCFGAISGSVSIVGSGSATLAGATLSARAGANLVPAALPNRISRVPRENRIIRA